MCLICWMYRLKDLKTSKNWIWLQYRPGRASPERTPDVRWHPRVSRSPESEGSELFIVKTAIEDTLFTALYVINTSMRFHLTRPKFIRVLLFCISWQMHLLETFSFLKFNKCNENKKAKDEWPSLRSVSTWTFLRMWRRNGECSSKVFQAN